MKHKEISQKNTYFPLVFVGLNLGGGGVLCFGWFVWFHFWVFFVIFKAVLH